MEQISVSDLISKFPTLHDQRLFLKESGFYFPNYRGFDTKFFISFLRGEKKLLKIGQVGGTSIPFFTKSNHFTRSHLLSYFRNIPELKAYLPDDINEKSLIREYLLNVLFYVRGDIYNDLYNDYKKIKVSRTYNRWNEYYVNVPNGVKEQIDKYHPIKSEIKGAKPFRTSKNKSPIKFFNKILNKNNIEPIIPKQGFIPPGINVINNNNQINFEDNSEDEESQQNRILNEMQEI